MKKRYIPNSIFWQPVSITLFVAGLFMSMFAGINVQERYKERTAVNKLLTFKNELYHEIAQGPGFTNDQNIQAIASYLQEHQNELAKIVQKEKQLRASLGKSERMMVHIQNPDKLPQGLLLMTDNEQWQELRENKQDYTLLMEILYKTVEPPDITLLDYPNLPTTFIYLSICISQLLAFVIYLINLKGAYKIRVTRDLHWYQLSWIGKAGFLLLMPGALIVLLPMMIYECARMTRSWLKQGEEKRFMRQKSLRNGLSLEFSSSASNAFLKKLQRNNARKEEVRHADISK